MICPKCGANIPEGKKFCEECGTALKPNFDQQTAYRKETFERGPDPAPDPAKPLPVSEHERPKPKGQEATAAPQAQQKKSNRGCLIGIIVVAIGILLVVVSCSVLGRFASSVVEQSSTGSSSTYTASSGTSTSSPAQTASDAEDTWTVLFYLCGSDLESQSGLATMNLQELTKTKLGEKVTFAIEAGGSRSWQNATVSPRYLTRYSLDASGFYEEQKLPKASMASASTFSEFIRWGVKEFPADHYMLVVWDHGGGSVYGVCNDELFPYDTGMQADTLTLTEMKEGLKTAGITFDIIGFDTCLMATYETAALLAPYADFLVASEEVEPGTGWDYSKWPSWLASHAGATGDQLGAEICDTFYEKCKKYREADMATLSVIDLSKVASLNESFAGASREMAQATGDRSALRALRKGASQATYFGGGSEYNMIDLGDFMRKASSAIPEYYDDVIADVNTAVVYQVHGRSRSNVMGLSVFYPLDTSYSPEFYGFLDVAGNVPYAQFVAVMFGLYNRVDWNAYAEAVIPSKAPVERESIVIEHNESVNSEGQLQLEITKGLENVAGVEVQMSLYLPNDGAIVYLGTDYNITGDWKTGVFADNFYGTWMAIDGNVVCTTLLEAGDGYNLYYVPILLNGESTNLIVRRDTNANTYGVVCSCPVVDDHNLAPKDMRALEEGDVIELRFEGYLLSSDEPITFNMGEVTWSDDVVVEDVDLGDGAYLFRFVITDILGDEHVTDLYVQDYRNGEIAVEPLADYLKRIL